LSKLFRHNIDLILKFGGIIFNWMLNTDITELTSAFDL
jgi:hypothetical protein